MWKMLELRSIRMSRVILGLDLDGTIVNSNHRYKPKRHGMTNEQYARELDIFYDRNAMLKDLPIEHSINAVQGLLNAFDINVVITTSRRKSSENVTREWLTKNIKDSRISAAPIIMREDSDITDHATLKRQEFIKLTTGGNKLIVYDDMEDTLELCKDIGFVIKAPISSFPLSEIEQFIRDNV